MSALHHFERQANALICRLDGETIRVEPWGPDSLRVRAALLEDPDRGSIALLDPDPADAADTAVEIGADCASLRHGQLTARVGGHRQLGRLSAAELLEPAGRAAAAGDIQRRRPQAAGPPLQTAARRQLPAAGHL